MDRQHLQDARASPAHLLGREVIPDPRGFVSFGILLLVLAGHAVLAPDMSGCLFRYILDAGPSFLRIPIIGTALDAVGQAFLFVGPPLCTYAGLRHLIEKGDSLLPYLTVAAGGFLTLLTGIGLLYS